MKRYIRSSVTSSKSTDPQSEYEYRKHIYLKRKHEFETLGEDDNNDVLSREEKMNIAKAEMDKVNPKSVKSAKDATFKINEIKASEAVSDDDNYNPYSFMVGDQLEWSGLYGGEYKGVVTNVTDEYITVDVMWTAEDTGDTIIDTQRFEIATDPEGRECIIVYRYRDTVGYVYPPSNEYINSAYEYFDKVYGKCISEANQDINTIRRMYANNEGAPSTILLNLGYTEDESGEAFTKSMHTAGHIYETVFNFVKYDWEDGPVLMYVLRDGEVPKGWTVTKFDLYDEEGNVISSAIDLYSEEDDPAEFNSINVKSSRKIHASWTYYPYALYSYTPGDAETGIEGDKFDIIDVVKSADIDEAKRYFKNKRILWYPNSFVDRISDEDYNAFLKEQEELARYESAVKSHNGSADEVINSSYSPDLLNDLVNYYRPFDTMSSEEIWDEIVTEYNNEDLANDVLESLDHEEDVDLADEEGAYDVYSSSDIKASMGRYDEYFGKTAAATYGDLIADRLRGKSVSKRRDTANEPGGLIYEANKLGIDMWDLLEALEGMCNEGRAREIDDSTYEILGSSNINASRYDEKQFAIEELSLSGEVSLGRCSKSTLYRWAREINDRLESGKYDWRVKPNIADNSLKVVNLEDNDHKITSSKTSPVGESYRQGDERTFGTDDDEFYLLEDLAYALKKKSPNKHDYFVEDCYLDFGSGWMWTTVVDGSTPGSNVQVLNPRQWLNLINQVQTPEEIADEILNGEYCQDKKNVKSSKKVHSSVEGSEEFEEYEDDIKEIDQEFTSENTSINSTKLPAVFRMVQFEPGTINIDYGGGRFDNVADYLTQFDVINLVYDPYNRSKEHNKEVIRTLRKAGGADTATCSNVLNVIKEPEVRKNVLENISKIVKPSGKVYITVYEGSGKGDEGPTKSGYQLNRKTADYLEEIQQVFPDARRRGKLIVATNSRSANSSTNIKASSTEGYVYTYCDECGKKNRVKVTFNNFNKPFNDTEYKCKYCGTRNLLTDLHSYDENGNVVEASQSYLDRIEELMEQGLDEDTASREAYAEFYPDEYDADDYDEIYSATTSSSRYWYFTRHGVQPGSVPKYVNILDIIDTPEGSYFLADGVILTDDLRNYEIKERKPKNDVAEASKSTKGETVEAGYYDIPEPPIDPPEDDSWTEVDGWIEDVDLDVDAIIEVLDDGSWIYEDETYPWAVSKDSYNGDHYSYEYYVHIGDPGTIVEDFDDVIEKYIPSEEGRYHLKCKATLKYFIEGVEVKQSDYYDEEVYKDNASVEFDEYDSKVENVSVERIW